MILESINANSNNSTAHGAFGHVDITVNLCYESQKIEIFANDELVCKRELYEASEHCEKGKTLADYVENILIDANVGR